MNFLINVLSDVVKPNVSFDEKFTEKTLKRNLQAISYTTGFISKGQSIIEKGGVVEEETFVILSSLREEMFWTLVLLLTNELQRLLLDSKL